VLLSGAVVLAGVLLAVKIYSLGTGLAGIFLFVEVLAWIRHVDLVYIITSSQ
jgi:hypothetical protein